MLLDAEDTPNNLSQPQEFRVSLLATLTVSNECVTSRFVIAKQLECVALEWIHAQKKTKYLIMDNDAPHHIHQVEYSR